MRRARESTGVGKPESSSRRAVLLMAYGGPDSIEDVEPYLLDVRGGRPTPPELVEEVKHRYAAIGGRSPLLEITRMQAQALEDQLNECQDGDVDTFRVYVGMRHWQPRIRRAVEEIVRDGIHDVVALCLAPHYSRMSVGAYFDKLREAIDALDDSRGRLSVSHVESWHDHPLLIRALAEKVTTALDRFPSGSRSRVRVVFTAHSLPASVVEAGDPYETQLHETAGLVAKQVGLDPGSWQVCYQSAGARSVRWLGPSVEEVIVELSRSGQREILVAPVGFVSDHVEILYDLDVEAKAIAAENGTRLERTESLNTTPLFVEALADVVRGRIARR